MDAEPDAPSEKRSDSPVRGSARTTSGSPITAAASVTLRDPLPERSLESSIKASSGLSPPLSPVHASATAAAAPPAAVAVAVAAAAAAAAPAAPTSRRSPSTAPAARRPLPGSAPTHITSSANPTSAQPARDASASATISAISHKDHKDRMSEFEKDKDGKDEPSTKSPSNPPSGRQGSIAVRASSVSSSAPAMALEDEIVVGTKTNGGHSSSTNAASDQEDVDMSDVKEVSPAPSYPKRKRNSVYTELDEERMEQSSTEDVEALATRAVEKAFKPPAQPSMTTQRSITLGYWRDSAVPDVKEKHAVVGFIDTRDRLRTRIQQSSRTGKFVAADFPLPPGPGGSWVTFERVVFEQHLVGLDHNQVKEYVKIRSENPVTHESVEEEQAHERAAVAEAIHRAALHPTPDNLPAPAIAYGAELPDYVINATRPEKKRRMASNNGFGAFSSGADSALVVPGTQQALAPAGGLATVASAIQRSAIDLLPGTRPTKILLGYWRGSSEERPEDKHAVFGILGANDMFRVKVTRETRDGRPVMGNFPTGAGALWIHYDEVEFEKHIRHLSRPEVKEYVRVRQRQLDEGEKPEHRIENETKAVYEAQARVISAGGAAQSTLGTAGRVDTISFASAANLNNRHAESALNDLTSRTYSAHDGRSRREYEPRQTRRSFAADGRESAASIAAAAMAVAPPPRAGRHSLPDGAGLNNNDLRPANRPPPSDPSRALTLHQGNNPNAERVERTNSLARREVARVETIQMRNEQRAASRDANMASNALSVGGMQAPGENAHSGVLVTQNGNVANGAASNNNNNAAGSNGANNRLAFSENIGRLNKVWAAQEASRMRAVGEDAKMYMGVKYERKQTGPFQGKLVSPGTILSIDGEDYVEYRVLTKPTFF